MTEIANSLSEGETYIIEFRYKRKSDYPVGRVRTFKIYPRLAAPTNLKYDAATYILSGVSKDMEYRETGQTSWRAVTGTTINLKTFLNGRPNVQIEVRYKPVTMPDSGYTFASSTTIVNLY